MNPFADPGPERIIGGTKQAAGGRIRNLINRRTDSRSPRCKCGLAPAARRELPSPTYPSTSERNILNGAWQQTAIRGSMVYIEQE